MSDEDSLYDSTSPSPESTDAISGRSPKLDEGKAVNTGLPSLPSSAGNSNESSSPEPEITGDLAVRPSQKNDSEAVEYGAATLPSPPPDRSPKENLLVEITILGEDSHRSDEEARSVPANIDNGKGEEREEEVGERPDTVDEDGYAFVAPDPEVEVFVVTTEDERGAEATRASFEEDARDIYPIGPKEVTGASASVPAITAKTIHEENTATEHDDVDGQQPTTGIERPVQKLGRPKTFVIVRLIENTDKRGNNIKSAIRLRKHYFDTDFGDFLLDMSGPRTDTAQVRNYAGQERYIPRRMLQNVYQPWDIPAKTKITDNGVPLPLAFLNEDMTAEEAGGNVAFEDEEAVMVMDRLDGNGDQQVLVTDWERKAGSFGLKQLDQRYERPWGILIDKDDLIAAWTKTAAPKLPKGKQTGKGTKRKRKDDEDDDDDTDDDDDGDTREGTSKKATGKKVAGKKATGKKAAKKPLEDDMDDFIVDDKSAEDGAAGQSKAAAGKNPAGKRPTAKQPTKKPKLDDAVEDEEVEPSEVAKGKRPAGKTTASMTTSGKTTSGKKSVGKKPAGKEPAGKKPVKKTTGAKKTSKGKDEALLEAVAEEEESGEEDMA